MIDQKAQVEKRYIPGNSNIIWDIFPIEFTTDGYFEQFLNSLKKQSFQQLLFEEKKRVQIFLDEWEKQLRDSRPCESIDLNQLFLNTPRLSGVLYFSHNTVISEAFFQTLPDKIGHPTDRVIHETSKQLLPSSKDLTFSFPRKYFFEGFANSWGFVRVNRKNDENYGAGIALSVTTLDPEVMHIMRELKFQHLAHLYNQSWNFAIHDYIHHIALYTNPSFAIGKISPMSLLHIDQEIDQWGEDMKDTFNYEYWSHRTHRLITQPIIHQFTSNILLHADEYFTEIAKFQKAILQKNPKQIDLSERIGIYLCCIYLWPLHILLHPNSPEMEQIGNFVERIYLNVNAKRIQDAHSSLIEIGIFTTPEEKLTPLQKGIKETLRELDLLKKWPTQNTFLSKYQYIRLKTDLVVQRGMYESWHHDTAVLFQNKATHPLEVMHIFLKKLSSTFAKYEEHPKRNHIYELHGIVPKTE